MSELNRAGLEYLVDQQQEEIIRLRAEVEEMQAKLTNARERYARKELEWIAATGKAKAFRERVVEGAWEILGWLEARDYPLPYSSHEPARVLCRQVQQKIRECFLDGDQEHPFERDVRLERAGGLDPHPLPGEEEPTA